MKMKMKYKNVVKVSIGFSIVMLFWYGYDFVIPLLLDNIFGLPDHLRGLVMGFDNLLSIMLLPLFGRLSDKTNTRFGKRKPFIFIGTIMAALLMIFVPLSANMQFDSAIEIREDILQTADETMLTEFYEDAEDGKNTKYIDIAFLERSEISKEEYASYAIFTSYRVDSEGLLGETEYYRLTEEGDKVSITQEEYQDMEQKFDVYVRPGLNTYISDQVFENVTSKDITPLITYLIVLFFVLVAMSAFRSPTVALMPDVTPKPFRSQANAIVNLAGGLGAGIAFIIYTIWFSFRPYPYVEIFATMGGAMLILLMVFLRLVNEPKLVQEKLKMCEEFGIVENDEEEQREENEGLSEEQIKANKRRKNGSLLLILGSVFFFFLGHYSIQTNLSVYATRNLLFEPSIAGIITAVSMAVSGVAFIPVGFLAAKYGRRKSILIGFAFAALGYFLNFLIVRPDATRMLFPVFFLIGGIGMVITNVNTFPMVVELSSSKEVGKFTGYYYMAAMSGQAISPFLGGLFMGMQAHYLFIYAAVCIGIAMVLMVLVKHGHGDSKPTIPSKGQETLAVESANGSDVPIIEQKGKDTNKKE